MPAVQILNDQSVTETSSLKREADFTGKHLNEKKKKFFFFITTLIELFTKLQNLSLVQKKAFGDKNFIATHFLQEAFFLL